MLDNPYRFSDFVVSLLFYKRSHERMSTDYAMKAIILFVKVGTVIMNVL